ncbi:hypothetical protein Q3G72_009078 [Acer saccharum]|nr:hypothetical protein Q3G72_000747 [Acer saccharum]KAK1549861.1 hypothetical protein Q3G72_009078 [Acer saccharum]
MAVLLKFLLQVPSLLVILWLLSSSCSAKETGEGQQYPPSSHIVSISSLLPSTVCNRSSKVSRIGSLELVHKYGPCSELNKQGETTSTPSLSEILHEDQARVDSINSRRRGSMMKSDTNQELIRKTKLPFSYDVSIGTGNFYVKVDIGTPRQSVYVVLDTGSDITWIQCKPCSVKCFKQVGTTRK